ncbi:hypothetical protein H6P81_010961 [Aristolochia fimbriata]|uniref:Uncharacterized protein n=1 Tax=Aristolochia fimbriata TaxID=158543 RepID=A0AAV7ERC5_ARIFI|nr:hypothetical protein H6P81_010961 [Aristolochia fimbriata]
MKVINVNETSLTETRDRVKHGGRKWLAEEGLLAGNGCVLDGRLLNRRIRRRRRRGECNESESWDSTRDPRKRRAETQLDATPLPALALRQCVYLRPTDDVGDSVAFIWSGRESKVTADRA